VSTRFTRTLPDRPHLDQLKRQAKELLEAFHAGDRAAAAEVQVHFRGADRATFALHDAQLVIARAHGFSGWSTLKARVDGVTMARFVDVVRARDVAGAGAMLASRPELAQMDVSENDEHTGLHFAVLNRDAEMVRVLMRHGADPRKGIWPVRQATGALTLAQERGFDDIAGIIREEEERRRPAGGDAAPPLPPAPPNLGSISESQAIAMLESQPAWAHARHPEDGLTALHIACAMLWGRVADRLLALGADVHARARSGVTPLETIGASPFAAGIDRNERAAAMSNRLLAAGAERTALWAVGIGDLEWLRARHAEGALVNRVHQEHGGLLARAVRFNRPDVLELLLGFGFDPDERVRLQELDEPVYSASYPLHACAKTGKLALAELLLKHGADPNAHVYAAGPPIYVAHSERNAEMIALLERHGGVLDAESVGHLGLVDRALLLLEDEQQGTLCEGMVTRGRTVAECLLLGGAGTPGIARAAVPRLQWPEDDQRWYWTLRESSGNVEAFRAVLARSGPNRRGSYGRTILHDVVVNEWVGAEERVTMMTMLLEAGARTDVRDDLLASTPLGWACRWGRLELVALLLERGADPVEANAESWATPRAWATTMGTDAIVARLDLGRA
jgi:ankyrin repeat protein